MDKVLSNCLQCSRVIDNINRNTRNAKKGTIFYCSTTCVTKSHYADNIMRGFARVFQDPLSQAKDLGLLKFNGFLNKWEAIV